jgi:hypothetical protein
LIEVWKTDIDDLEDEPPSGVQRSRYHWSSWCCQKDLMIHIYSWLHQAVWGTWRNTPAADRISEKVNGTEPTVKVVCSAQRVPRDRTGSVVKAGPGYTN